MRIRKVAMWSALLALPLVGGAFIKQSKEPADGARLFAQILQRIEDNAVDSLSRSAIYEKAARGLVKNLQDPYADLYSPEELASFQRNTLRNDYAGLGMQIRQQDDQVVIEQVFPNTPAAAGGLIPGDHIVMIDSLSTIGWRTGQVSEKLIGKAGTSVELTVRRVGVPQAIRGKFIRANIRVPAVPYTLVLDNTIGYIPLQAFNNSASDDVSRALMSLKGRGVKSYIIDLRQNGGGALDQALDISNLFLRAGQEISSVRHRGRQPEVYTANRPAPLVDSMPVVVLVDGATASASEIVAGSLQDHDRALVVGTTSYGKGLVQTLFQLDGGWAIKLTTGKWYTPSGRSIQAEHDRLEDERFVEYAADSASGAAKHKRPEFKSDAGRIILGGGGITPDVVIEPDTTNAAERELGRAVSPTLPAWFATIASYAQDMKPNLRPDFTVTPAMRDEFFNRLISAKVNVTRAQFEAAQPAINRMLELELTKWAFGDSAKLRRSIPSDEQLSSALGLLKRAASQRQLLAMVEAEGKRKQQ
jgi:carboxyl-terminal processing protease